jgi:hypothetical protein
MSREIAGIWLHHKFRKLLIAKEIGNEQVKHTQFVFK